ncbi:MAG: GEGP motif-containing diheme protein [Candidatus Eisenbacteria bacterium]
MNSPVPHGGAPASARRFATILLFALTVSPVTTGCSDEGDVGAPTLQSSRSYQGHSTDADIDNFVRNYQHTIGTRLDDCQTCHQGATVFDDRQGEVRANPCDYCHYVIHPAEGWSGLPGSFEETLNSYGVDYSAAGRSTSAIQAIDGMDSDGDGHTNAAEIEDLRYPGDEGSHPGLPLCAVLTVTLNEIRAMPAHSQFGLANTNKQQFDYYANYKGVRIVDLLTSVGVDLTGATSVDVLAPDGFARSFTVAQITDPFPSHRFFSGLGVESLGDDCAFVEYPADVHGYAYGDTIANEQWHIMAYERDGLALEASYLDPSSGRINGEGPFRNVIPPGATDDALNRPDRGKGWDTSGCTMHEWDYAFETDHNAGSMVKGAVILRIEPMPEGCEEFDIINGGWAMVDAEEILIYGHGVNAE